MLTVLFIALLSGASTAERPQRHADTAGGSINAIISDLGIGKQRELTKDVHISVTEFEEIKRNAADGDKEAQYFAGLLHFYGHDDIVAIDYSRALKYFRDAALQGHTKAQVNVGLTLANGYGNTSKDEKAAVAFFKSAAVAEDSDAQWYLGRMFYEGRGVSRDFSKALELFHDSARQNNANGIFHLGIMYEYGLGTGQDFSKAATLYEQAAYRGSTDASYYLALMKAYGRGMQQDITKAAILFKKSAEQGHAPSQYYLGMINLHGQGGLERNYEIAYYWLDKARNGNDEDTKNYADAAIKELEAIAAATKDRSDAFMKRFNYEL